MTDIPIYLLLLLYLGLPDPVLKGNLAHNFMISHLAFLFCPLDLVTVIPENNENIHIISVYREKRI